jgi:hypothetical protein
MKKELNYLATKVREKVGLQELRSTLCKQEIDPWWILLAIKDTLSLLKDGQQT